MPLVNFGYYGRLGMLSRNECGNNYNSVLQTSSFQVGSATIGFQISMHVLQQELYLKES